MKIDRKDLRLDTFRNEFINVRVTHIPSGRFAIREGFRSLTEAVDQCVEELECNLDGVDYEKDAWSD